MHSAYGQTNKPKQPDPNKPITVTLPASTWISILNYLEKDKQINQYSTLPAVDIKNHNDTLSIIQNVIYPFVQKGLSDTTTNKK